MTTFHTFAALLVFGLLCVPRVDAGSFSRTGFDLTWKYTPDRTALQFTVSGSYARIRRGFVSGLFVRFFV